MLLKILIIDSDQASVEAIIETLKRESYDLFAASDVCKALETLATENIDLVIMAENMPDLSGIGLLKRIKDNYPHTQVILIGCDSIETTGAGADGYLKKPIQIDNLHQTVEEAFGFANIIGTSKPMRKLFCTIQRVAPTNAAVLIRGESGVGKELIANAIHNHSRRKDKPYRTINCGALYRELLESELFGHERGAFTGATTRKLGLFEQANDGTLLLDEVGEMGPETQVKFLRVLEGQEFTRLGGDKPIKTDVRIIAATNADLEEAVKNGKFRNDLYHRINRFPIRVPPLRERREDIPLLVSAFIKEFSKEHDRPVSGITLQAMDYLKNAAWDGNIRELRNTIEAAIILAETETLKLDNVSLEFQTASTDSEVSLDTDATDNQESGERKSVSRAGSVDKPAEILELDDSSSEFQTASTDSEVSLDTDATDNQESGERKSVSRAGSVDKPAEILELDDSSSEFQTASTDSEVSSKCLLEYSVAMFCLLCSQDGSLTLEQIAEWIQQPDAQNHDPLVSTAKAEISSWYLLNRSDLVTKVTEVVEHTVNYLSNLLSVPVPQPVILKKQTLDCILAEICRLFLREYNGSEETAARALGLPPEDFRNKIEQSEQDPTTAPPDPCTRDLNPCPTDGIKPSEQDSATAPPDPYTRKLNPFPTDEVKRLLQDEKMCEFLTYPMNRRRLNALDVRDKLRTVRLALSVLAERLKGKYGSIYIGGMVLEQIESGIYYRATYLYATKRQVRDILGKSRPPVDKALLQYGISESSDFPSPHTLF
jgi:two-component system response regulator AtoC